MSPVIAGDFSKISSNSDPLKPGTYRFRLDRIEDQSQNPEWQAAAAVALAQGQQKSAALIFVSEVTEGDRAGTEIQDYVYPTTKKGTSSKIGLGRIKAYSEAIQGQEAANNPRGIDTDTLPGGEFQGIMEENVYMDQKVSPPVQKKNVQLAKVLPI